MASLNFHKFYKRPCWSYSVPARLSAPPKPSKISKLPGTLNRGNTYRSESVSKSGVLSCGLSDHDAVFMTKHLRLPKLKASPKLLNVRNYEKFHLKAFRKDMNNVLSDEIKNISRNTNEMWTLWKSFSLDILIKHAPITNIQVKGNKISYVKSELKAMIRQRDYLWAEADKTGSSVLRQAYNQVRAKVNKNYMIFRKKTFTPARLNNTSMTLKIHGKYLKAQLEKISAIGKAYKTIEIKKINFEGKEFTDEKQITELCNEHIVSIGDKLAKTLQPSNEQALTGHIQPATVKFRFRSISVSQVTEVIKKLVNSKGIHGIPDKHSKNVLRT